MSSSLGLLGFFIAEAGDCAVRLDELVASAGPAGPDTALLLRHARALRGSSTMSRQDGIARVARALERVAHALRDGTRRWDPALAATLRTATSEMTEMIRRVRTWSQADEEWARACAEELERLAAAATAPAASRAKAEPNAEPIVPIADLFPDGPGLHVIYAAPYPTAAYPVRTLSSEQDVVIPIEALLYRGRSALARAITVRDDIRGRGDALSSERLAELFDLLDLAAAE